MFIGSAYVQIRIYEAYSLKDRRQILSSVTGRLRNKFNCAVSVLDGGELWNLAEIGIVSVSASQELLASMLDKMRLMIEEDGRFEVLTFDGQIQKEILG